MLSKTARATVLAWLGKNKVLLAVVASTAIILGLFLPAPYNFRYEINRLTRQATFQCSDGIYSFAADSRGACGGHGPITAKFNPDGSNAPPTFKCMDGSPSWAVVSQGACSGHGGIDESDDVVAPTVTAVPFKMPKTPTFQQFEQRKHH